MRRGGVSALVFALALAARLAYLFHFDDPLLSTEWSYLQGGLRIAEHEAPLRFVWTSDAWREWGVIWVVSPLYYVAVAAVFGLTGSSVRAVQLAQCGTDAVTAVLIGALGRRLAPRWGTWAGVAYALYWPAVNQPTRLLSENAHTPLLLAGVFLLVRNVQAAKPRALEALAAGTLLGLSALARAVTFAFLPVAALWRARLQPAGRAAAVLLALGAAAAIGPWWLRNVVVMGDPAPIETLAFYNLYKFNSFVSPERLARRDWFVRREPTPSARRQRALAYAVEGVRENPGAFAHKVVGNVRHFLRPEGLHQLFGAEWPRPAAWHAGNLVLGDLVLVPAVFLFAVFLVAGPRAPARTLLLLWTSYYLVLVVVVYNAEIRYRTALVPFVLAAAPAGLATLLDRKTVAWRRWAGLGLAAALVAIMLAPQAPRVVAGLHARSLARQACDEVARGDIESAERTGGRAAARAPRAVSSGLIVGRCLAEWGRLDAAIAVYGTVVGRRGDHPVAAVAAAPLLREAGRSEEADLVSGAVDRELTRLDENPTLLLEGAWEWLKPPRTNEVRLGRDDFGAVRNFHHDRGEFRWARHRASVRMVPAVAAPRYDLVVEMGSPEPSPFAAPVVEIAVRGGASARVTLDRSVRPFTLRTEAPAGPLVVVDLTAPSWNRAGQPPDQTVRVDRVELVPVP
jgi:4-amino-4-deoxy-L-arabinose transferase-like glycosyltransferase